MLKVLSCYHRAHRIKGSSRLLLLFTSTAIGRCISANLICFDQVLEAKLHQVEKEVEDVVGGFEASNKITVVLFLLIEAFPVFKLSEVDVVVEVSCRN